MNCKICSSETSIVFKAKLLNKYNVDYYKCSHCDFLCTEEPYWLNEAYSSAIANSDTGIVLRNFGFRQKIPEILNLLDFKLGSDIFLDYAGGGGIFVRLMRDIGLDFFWYDKYCQNWVANGFEADLTKAYDAITTFECFEHFSDPIKEIKQLFKNSNTIIFSTELLPSEVPDVSWWYYSFDEGQHISFYSAKTLEYIATKLGYRFYKFNGVFCFTKKSINSISYRLFMISAKFNIVNKIRFKLITKQLTSKTVSDMYQVRARL